jgi:protein SCO1
MSQRLTRKSRATRGRQGLTKRRGVTVSMIFAVMIVILGAIVGSKFPPPTPIGGPFTLIDQDGKAVSNSTFLGRPLLVFFGYTHCQDVCPVILFEISEILRGLGSEAKIQAIFVTVDPERDTPLILKDYLANFDSRIVGLSGDRKEINQILQSFRIYSRKVLEKGDDYSIDHTTVVYLMGKDGQFLRTFDVSRRPIDATRDLARYL